MTQKTIKQLKKGEWFTIKPIAEPSERQVYIRGEYDRESKRYICGCFWDIADYRAYNGDKKVYVDFIF